MVCPAAQSYSDSVDQYVGHRLRIGAATSAALAELDDPDLGDVA